MATKIVTKNSSTASAVPTASDLVQGELAVNVADKRLFTEDNGGAIVELGTNPSSLTVSGNIDVDGVTNLDAVDIDGAVDMASTLTVAGEITANGGIALGDNDKATFGAGDDLQIYHDGSHSYIKDVGTGDLLLSGANVRLNNPSTFENYLYAVANGAVTLYYDNNEKLATTSTGIDVTGTATMDGLSVTGDIEQTTGDLKYTGNINWDIAHHGASQNMLFRTTPSGGSATQRMRVSHNGDISFYEDTGTTPKLFWDASAESLGIGTTSPSQDLEILNGSTGAGIRLAATDTAYWDIERDASTGHLTFTDDGAGTVLTVGQDGNVGIGTSSPSSQYFNNLVVGNDAAGDKGITIRSNASNRGVLAFSDTDSATDGRYSGFISYDHSDNAMKLHTNGGNERMRIDSSGRLLVGKTTSDISVNGVRLNPTGTSWFTQTSDYPIGLNRKSTDGTILNFSKDGTTVGSIGSLNGAYLYIGSTGGVDTFASFHNGGFRPATSTGVDNDAALNLGDSGGRWKDLYLSGGVYLGGTGAANKLDDYEEGTWTPTLSGATTNPTPTAVTVTNANYTKIGNTVFIRAYINVNLSNVGSGGAQIEGLPFAVKVGTYAPALFTHGSLIHSSGGYFASGATRIVAIADNSVNGAPFAGTGAVRYLMITGQYETA